MASLLPENSGIKRGSDDELQGFDVSEINGSLLMSLLEEPQPQGYENDIEERLQSVIQSLEAEINPALGIKSELLVIEEDEHFCMDEMEGSDDNCFDLSNFEWADIKQLVLPSSPSDEMNWHMDTSVVGDQLDMDFIGIAHEYGGVRDYSQIHLDEPAGDSLLWQQTYDSILYN